MAKEICFTCNKVKIPMVCLDCRGTYTQMNLDAQKRAVIALIEDRHETVDNKGQRLVREIWVEDLLRAIKNL